MARWPAPGRCKSRLAAGIGPSRAAAIQARLTLHTLLAAQQLEAQAARAGLEPPPQLVLAVAGLGRRAAQRWGRELAGARIRPQGTGTLAVRLRRQLLQARREGARTVVVVGSDLPSLQGSDLLTAFEALEQWPLVIGPARDGGYWLIGLAGKATAAQGPATRLWTGADRAIAWGSAQVLEQTLEAAAAAGLSWRLLEERGDLDRPDDLRPWR